MYTGILKEIARSAASSTRSLLRILRKSGVVVSIEVESASVPDVHPGTPVFFDPLGKSVKPMRADL